MFQPRSGSGWRERMSEHTLFILVQIVGYGLILGIWGYLAFTSASIEATIIKAAGQVCEAARRAAPPTRTE